MSSTKLSIQQMEDEIFALRVDVSYWHKRYELAKVEKGAVQERDTEIIALREEVHGLKELIEQHKTREWKQKAAEYKDIFTEDGWQLMCEAAEKEPIKSRYWEEIVKDVKELVLRGFGYQY